MAASLGSPVKFSTASTNDNSLQLLYFTRIYSHLPGMLWALLLTSIDKRVVLLYRKRIISKGGLLLP
jgi:hypothetical protein